MVIKVSHTKKVVNRGSASRILLVGPDPSKKALGGVVQHMKNLQQLSILKNAQFFDPGSTSGRFSIEIFKVIRNCLILRETVSTGRYGQVWINSSIYFTAFIKLLLLLSLGNLKETQVRVFFHGGRFKKIRYLHLKPFNSLAKKILSRVDSFHFLSREQGEEFENMFPDFKWNEFSNYLPFDTPVIPRDSKKKNLLFVGRVVREKGICEILAALDHLIDHRVMKDFCFWFVGDGSEMDYLRSEAQKRPQDMVYLYGQLKKDALEAVYAQSFVLLLPSYHQEGFPYVVIEAMRAGLPVIATPTGVLPDLIQEGKNGFIIPPQNPNALARAIEILLDNSDLYTTISTNNMLYFQGHLSKTAAEKYYSSLLSPIHE